MKIYTKKGDKGMTSNVKGLPVSKASESVELLGTIDELNAGIGFLRSLVIELDSAKTEVPRSEIDKGLAEIQKLLYQIGTDISTDFEQDSAGKQDVKKLEQWIDVFYGQVGQQTSFIYYSGSKQATYAQVVRSIVRRAERRMVSACEGQSYPQDGQYLNRLADYFYALGRYLNYLADTPDEPMHL